MDEPKKLGNVDWVTGSQVCQMLGVRSLQTFTNYKKHLRTCGLHDMPKKGFYTEHLPIIFELKKEIERNGVLKARMKVKELIKEYKQAKQEKKDNE